jgi:hypothetical protein
MEAVFKDIFARVLTPHPLPKPVHSLYIASRIKRALLQADPSLRDGQIITSVGAIETIGDCRYAIAVTDYLGNTHNVAVEVVRRPTFIERSGTNEVDC